MTRKSRTVTVKQLPSKVDRGTERALLHELALAMQVERPALVLDCSQIRHMNSNAVHLLLCCLEEAMKQNGDVRLAGLPEQAREVLSAWGAERLFRIFDTTELAEESFQRRSPYLASYSASNAATLASEHAA